MSIKGRATIELVNADGTNEFVKHDNMVTNALADLFRSYRGEVVPGLKLSSLDDDFVKNFFGGILLFNEKLNTDADDYMIPTTKVTGFAGQTSYSGLDVARGSCNDTESGLQPDGSYKLVWDFSTAQSNGSIQSVALCPKIMGEIGVSDTIQNSERKAYNDLAFFADNPYNSNGYLLTNSGSGLYTAGVFNSYLRIVAVIGDFAYAIDNSFTDVYKSLVLKLYRFNIGFKKIGLSSKIGRATYIDSIDITLPAEMKSVMQKGLSFTYDAEKNVLIAFGLGTYNVTTKQGIVYCEINLSDYSVVQKSFANTTPYSIEGTGTTSGDVDVLYVYIDETHIYVIAKVQLVGYYMYIIDRNDNTNINVVTYAGEALVCKIIIPMYRNKNVFVFAINSSSGNYEIYVVDKKTGVAKKTNSKDFGRVCSPLRINDAVFAKLDGYLGYRIVMNPFILTTKNNLDETITKTSSQTMKITYTLTEVAEGE